MPPPLELPALEITQGAGRTLYSFGVNGKLLPQFATVSRVRRGEAGEIEGYQRPEVRSHVAEIRDYLESDAPLLPNSIVVAFDERVSFRAPDIPMANPGGVRVGTLVIPVDEDTPDWEKPGWIVDGQQRVAAISQADIEEFHVYVTAFIAQDDSEQREQFILVNTTKPLPSGLIHELLPMTDTKLPSRFERKRLPAHLAEQLNQDPESPFYRTIRSTTASGGVINNNSILRMLENSFQDGVLRRFRASLDGAPNTEAMLRVLGDFWWAVRDAFPEAWDKPATRSRLMHGAGITSMGHLMDTIDRLSGNPEGPGREEFAAALAPLVAACHWTDGTWDFGPEDRRKWNEIENTPHDIRVLSDFLRQQYTRSLAAAEAPALRAAGSA